MKQRRTITAGILSALIGWNLIGGLTGNAQDGSPATAKQAEIGHIIKSAESHYLKGQTAYSEGEYEIARREFDAAIDAILVGSIDVRSDDGLRVYYRELIEKVNRYQIAALEQKDGGFSEQRYEPSPLDKIASLSEADLEEVADSAEVAVPAGRFNFNFTTSRAVNQFIGYFTRGRGRPTMEAGLQRSVRFREMAERIFKEEGVPTDLIWLAQVESGWNPYALSHANAKGIWQFIPSTGSRFGLSQNYWVDERSNPEKSTRAAARYLKWLAGRYRGDWQLALAGYNTGEGNIDSAIARSGSRDFWRIHSGGYIAQETRNYVPAILAVVTIAKNPKKYGFEMPPAYTYRYETRTIASQTALKPLAKKLKVSYGTLLDLNPELQRGVTPPGKHLIRIPAAALVKAEEKPPVSPEDSPGR
ncbi:MAG TPA: lytic transglycosylase domain-containing protein [Blastocatellia bacterium]|jgi:membrane-bound lytic murein transglycosylase D|nr:lytic transglycosylase domain-containing protein [Blastocatellia bacterium]